jgi:DNA-binding NtrC family response regulator
MPERAESAGPRLLPDNGGLDLVEAPAEHRTLTADRDAPGLLETLLARIDAVHAALLELLAERYYRARGVGLPDPDDLEVPGMVGVSAAIQAVFARLARTAVGDGPVLVSGETGTGKELAARAIHALGPRRRGPFIAVSCAALPRELVESELFGHRRGTFAGATGDHPGLFRSASGGTLLLDEITEMAPEAQAKLLRVLEERTVRPLGGVAAVPVDVRVVATTNRDPETATAAGALRADLYYRLAANRIVLPPLRERPDDVMPLVVHWRQQRVERRLAAPRVTPDALAVLQAQPWPGNVRELWNALDAAAAVAPDAIDAAALGSEPPPAALPAAEADVPTLADAERVLIARALERTGGNKRQAAQLLGISRTQLYAKIEKYGLGR